MRMADSARKHLILLVVLVAMLVLEPILAYQHLLTAVISTGARAVIYSYIFFVIFRRGWERQIAFVLFLPAAVARSAAELLTSPLRTTAAVLFHSFAAVFLGFAVFVILRGLFRRRLIRGDDVLGAVCGYILAGLVWGHFYALSYMFAPDAFAVSPMITPQFADPTLQHTLFDYLSFTTLTSIGFADMTPAGPPLYSLTWLETMFGQFYLAVVVAQLVGLKLAQAIRASDA